jgi:hypothetical protein
MDNGIMPLEWIVMKRDMQVWNGFMLLRIWFSGGFFWALE